MAGMASPFRIFRKYQKTLLVVAGVILMFVFVIGDSLVAYLSGSPRGSGESSRDAQAIAVSWDTSRLTNQELDQLMMRRRIVSGFLRTVHDEGVRSALLAGIDPRELRVQPLQALVSAPTEQGVVATMLYAEAARNAGIRVSDDAIVNYLDELGRQRVSRNDMRAMLNQAGGGRIPTQYMMDALREELLAHSYLASYQFAFHTVTPQQGYADWLRVNDRVVVEAAAVPAESLVVDVPEPTDAELTAFFDEHKQREPQPDLIGQMELPSPVPGFRTPRKIDVQFIQAQYDQFLAKVENEITDEQIAKYYDENKDPLFIKAETGLFDQSTIDEKPAAEEPATGSQTEEPKTEPSGGEPPAGNATPSADTNDSSTEDEPTGVSVEPNADSDSVVPPADEGAPADDEQSSERKNPRNEVFRLAAFAQEQEQAPAAENPEATESAASAAETQAAPVSPSASATADQPPATDDKPKEFQPLEDVRDEIRSRLARDRVNEQLTGLMSQLQSQVNGEFTSYFGERLSAESEGRALPGPPPALASLAPLAAQHGLTHGTTGPMSWLEMRETPVGASGDIETNRELYRILFATDDLDLYQPISTQDLDGNRYLAMKTSDTPGRIPTLAEKRDEVVRAWKLQKAADRALKHAEGLAKQAQEANKPLADFFAENQSVQVVRTDPFSRYTGGTVSRNLQGQLAQQPFRLSEPDGITAAGPDFMDEVFSLKDGEVGAVLNHDHSIAYVVRVAERMMATDALRDAYLSEAGNWPGISLMVNDHARIASNLLAADMITTRKLKWERPPDQQETADEEAEADQAEDE
jgi:hypothetical protein